MYPHIPPVVANLFGIMAAVKNDTYLKPEQTNEDKARTVGNDPNQLRVQLLTARSLLEKRIKQGNWKSFEIDFSNKRIVSDDGRYALQWKLRHNPDEPESYDNQQTSVGCVEVVELSKVVPV